jgi:hypothetical protein
MWYRNIYLRNTSASVSKSHIAITERENHIHYKPSQSMCTQHKASDFNHVRLTQRIQIHAAVATL